jgi:hypothetical protein
MSRVAEFGEEGSDAFLYAFSNYTLEEFKLRVEGYGGEDEETYLYAASIHFSCK